jgi:hypothetical protein
MLEILLMSALLAPITTAGLYVFLSGPGTTRNTPRHHLYR